MQSGHVRLPLGRESGIETIGVCVWYNIHRLALLVTNVMWKRYARLAF